jgi:hypothetical protein
MSIENLGIDSLHALSLGVYQVFLMSLFWEFIQGNVFGVFGPMSSRVDLTVARIREMLFSWYGSEERAGRQHPRVNQFSSSTLGSNTARAFRVHGAATNGLLYFARFMISRCGAALGLKLLDYRNGLDALIEIQESIKAHPRRYPPAALKAFVSSVSSHLHCVRRLGISFKPKHHLLIDLAGRLS